MSVAFGSPLTSANTNSAFVSRTQDTDMQGTLDNQNVTEAINQSTGAIHTDGGISAEKNIHGEQLYSHAHAGNKALVSGADKKVTESTVTTTELEFVSGVTSAIQTQINAKADDSSVVHKTGNETIAGEKTFTGNAEFDANVIIDGNLTVNGTTTTVNSATLDVVDQNVTVNFGGNDATGEGAGLTVDRTGTSGSLVYQDSLASKFKAGALGSESEIITAAAVQTITGEKTVSKAIISSELKLSETVDATATGASAVVSVLAPSIRLTNASLVSVTNFDDVAFGKIAVVTNDTGSAIDILNDVGGTAIKRILTGTGADLTLEDAASIIISYNSNKSRWVVVGGSGSGGGGALGFGEVPAGTVNGVNDTFGPLTYLPNDDDSLLVFVDGVQRPKTHYSVTGVLTKSIVFGGSHIPATDQDVYVWYITQGAVIVPPAPTGAWQVEYRTISGAENTAKAIVLSGSPASPTGTLLDIIGGGAQEYTVDFSVSGSTLSWNGLGLDGVLTTGDKLRVVYIT